MEKQLQVLCRVMGCDINTIETSIHSNYNLQSIFQHNFDSWSNYISSHIILSYSCEEIIEEILA